MEGAIRRHCFSWQGISTGRYHAGILSNCEDCQKAIFDAGKTCGDLNFPLPYCPELHFREFDSAVADMKNSVMVGLCQSVK